MATPITALAGLIWTTIQSLLSAKATETARHQQSMQQAEASVEQADYFNAQAEQTLADRRLLFDSASGAIDAARTNVDLDLVERWIAAEQAQLGPSRTDRTLFEDLLANWVLQHSESPGEANDDTSEVAYEDAAKNERAHKLVKAGKPLLFVHQLKFGLLGFGFGLSDHTVCAAIERKAQTLLGNGGVEAVKAATDGLVVSIPRVSNPVAFDRGVQRATAMPLGPEAGTLPNYQGPAGRGNVRSKVTLHVEEDEGCAVLSGLDFISSCIGPDREAYLRGVSTDHSDGGFADIEWEWTP